MQSLEKIGVLEQDEDKGGRRITQSGRRDLDRELERPLPAFSLVAWRVEYLKPNTIVHLVDCIKNFARRRMQQLA